MEPKTPAATPANDPVGQPADTPTPAPTPASSSTPSSTVSPTTAPEVGAVSTPVEPAPIEPTPSEPTPSATPEPAPAAMPPADPAPVPEPAPTPATTPAPTATAEANNSNAARARKILLVEDDDSLASVYQTRLQAEGFDIKRVPNGEEALAAAIAYKPDLILLDVMMPKVSGFDVLDILRNTPETTNVKVIMLTALSQETDKQRATSLGVDDYLVKSQVVIADVVDRIKKHLSL